MVTAVPEIQVEQLRPDHDFMIIACDGIWDCLTSQQAVDFVYEQKAKLAKKASHHDSSSNLKHAKTGTTTGAHHVRKAGASPSKKLTAASTSSLSKSTPSTTTITSLAKPAGAIQISKIVEAMLDKICPTNLAASEGLGTDNMTCIVIEFVKPDAQQS